MYYVDKNRKFFFIFIKRYSNQNAQISNFRFVSIVTVFVNKALLSGDQVKLDAPLFVTWVQCIVSVVICLLLGLVKRTNLPNPSDVFTANIVKTVRLFYCKTM